MTETADIVIIGGGVMGASIAYQLAKQGGWPGHVVGAASALQWHIGALGGYSEAALLE